MRHVVYAGSVPSQADVVRLLVTMVIVATGAGIAVIARPSWRAVGLLVLATVWWLWIGVDGPVLVSRGSHGLHLGDAVALIGALGAGAGALRLVLRRPQRDQHTTKP